MRKFNKLKSKIQNEHGTLYLLESFVLLAKKLRVTNSSTKITWLNAKICNVLWFLDYNDFLELQDCTDLKLDFGHFPVYIFVRGFKLTLLKLLVM